MRTCDKCDASDGGDDAVMVHQTRVLVEVDYDGGLASIWSGQLCEKCLFDGNGKFVINLETLAGLAEQS